jgi:transketolase
VSTAASAFDATVLRREPRAVSAPFSDALVDVGRARDELVVLSADLSRYTDVLAFAETFPDRFFQIGMAEANMMGIAGGLAKSGCLPVPVTYGVFATRRAYDQVAMALCTGASRAVIVAFLPGITTPFRATHQAIDDLALMRALPGMTVIDPLDASELRLAFRAAVEHDGPVYIRGLRGTVPELLDPERYRFRLGAVVPLREGGDVGLIGTGLGTRWALEAASELARSGIQAGVLHVPTLKPVEEKPLAAWCFERPLVMSIENHTIIGGLGSLVAETLAGSGAGPRLVRLGVRDRWADAGSLEYVRARLGLDAATLARTVRMELER